MTPTTKTNKRCCSAKRNGFAHHSYDCPASIPTTKATQGEHSRHTPGQIRQAQDLAVELGHLNKGIPSLIDLYAAAPTMLDALKYAIERYPKLAGSLVEHAINVAEGR